MGKRRVGTLSMGMLLIASGIMMFIAQISKQSILDIAVKGWPAILLLLGVEVLWYCYSSKEESPKVKYDVFSVFIICVIISFNFIMYSVIQFDIVSKVDMALFSSNYTLETPVEEIVLNDTIEKVVIDASQFRHITIYDSEDNKIMASGTAHVTADNIETAKELLKDKNIVSHTAGNTMYISFNVTSNGGRTPYSAYVRDYTLSIPSDKEVEINKCEMVYIRIDALNNNWIIDGSYHTKIRLNEDANVKISTFVKDRQHLEGNVEWTIREKTSQQESESGHYVEGELVYGNGAHSIYVLNNELVTVNKIFD